MASSESIIDTEDLVLVTGATGFLGPAVVEGLLRHGFRNIRALARASSDVTRLQSMAANHGSGAWVEVVRGNLLSREDCEQAARGVRVIFHLATGGDKSYPDAFMNSVVTTRNLLDAGMQSGKLRRFVNVSSFAAYDNIHRVLDETTPVERPRYCFDAYSFAKVKQDQIVNEYSQKHGVPCVTVRPGSVFGPSKSSITGRVGIDSFGFFLHLGGSNRIPLTYIDNCSDAIVLAGIKPGVESEVFNVVDDNLPTSRQLLRRYKKNVRKFRSFYVPRSVSYLLCWMWEKYADWSEGQLPPVFNRKRWRAEWKKTRYSNAKLKSKLGWTPKVSMKDGLQRYFQGSREALHA